MAKAKKQEKTIEQRLEEALVLYEKTPYELPSNWCWTTFEQIANLYTGNSINEREKELKYTGLSEGYNYIATKDIGFDYEIEYENGIKIPYEETRFKKARKGASLLCIEGGSAGRKLGFLQEEVCFVNKLCCFDFHGLVDKLYFYYLQSNEFFNLFNANKVGLIGGVSVNNLKQIAVPLAPLEEQKRIVEIIDKQFAKLDEARDLIQESLDTFVDRKSTILHKAFTGELTKGWRICKNIDIKSWDMIKLGQLGILERGKSKHRPRNDPKLFGGKYPFVQTGDIANANKYILYHKQTLSEAGLQQSKLFPKGTLCITIAANIGDVAILSYDCCFPDSVVGFTPYKEVSSEFIYYKMKTLQSDLEANAPATAQKNINLKILNDINICIPTFIEQEEIVRILNEFFEKEDKSKELIDMLDKIDEMKKSILARAFRGQLGTSNPTDEPATDLLRKILEQNN